MSEPARSEAASGELTPGEPAPPELTPAELVRDAYERLESRGYEAVLPLIDPEFTIEASPQLVTEIIELRGPEAIRRYFESFYEAMEEVRFVLGEATEVGADRVLVPATLVARGRQTGIEVEQQMVQLWTVRGGRAWRVQVFATDDEARAAAVEGDDRPGRPG